MIFLRLLIDGAWLLIGVLIGRWLTPDPGGRHETATDPPPLPAGFTFTEWDALNPDDRQRALDAQKAVQQAEVDAARDKAQRAALDRLDKLESQALYGKDAPQPDPDRMTVTITKRLYERVQQITGDDDNAVQWLIGQAVDREVMRRADQSLGGDVYYRRTR